MVRRSTEHIQQFWYDELRSIGQGSMLHRHSFRLGMLVCVGNMQLLKFPTLLGLRIYAWIIDHIWLPSIDLNSASARAGSSVDGAIADALCGGAPGDCPPESSGQSETRRGLDFT